jgi:hypothetical protein
MCHNLMRSIILKSVSQFHMIVTHQVGTQFFFFKKSVEMSSTSLTINILEYELLLFLSKTKIIHFMFYTKFIKFNNVYIVIM